MELVINFSGGKDSQVMLDYLCEKYPNVTKHVVWADTGWEHEGAEEWCRNEVARYGLKLAVVRNPNKDFFEMVERRGMFPGMKHRQCTSDLKRGPIMTWIRQNIQDPVVINCMGLRAEESAGRAKKLKLARNRESNSKRTIWDYLPIHRWTEKEVRQYLTERGIALHPVYGYLSRFSCRVCIFMQDHQLAAVAKHDPEAIQRVAEVEDRIGFTMMQRGKIKDLTQQQ